MNYPRNYLGKETI